VNETLQRHALLARFIAGSSSILKILPAFLRNLKNCRLLSPAIPRNYKGRALARFLPPHASRIKRSAGKRASKIRGTNDSTASVLMAFGSGPLATVIQDLLSVVIYLRIATAMRPS
jgi:hypothetical protein